VFVGELAEGTEEIYEAITKDQYAKFMPRE
jgi:hypothetical protein